MCACVRACVCANRSATAQTDGSHCVWHLGDIDTRSCHVGVSRSHRGLEAPAQTTDESPSSTTLTRQPLDSDQDLHAHSALCVRVCQCVCVSVCVCVYACTCPRGRGWWADGDVWLSTASNTAVFDSVCCCCRSAAVAVLGRDACKSKAV